MGAKVDTKTEIELIKDLKIEEGYSSKPYKDSVGVWTIGFGRNLKRGFTLAEHTFLFPEIERYPINLQDTVEYFRRKPMTEEEGLFLLRSDIKTCEHDAKIIYGDRWLSLPRDIKVSVLDMLFNLGLPKYLKFKKHIAAIESGDYMEAAKQVEESLAAAQAPNRYKAIAKRIREAKPDPSPRVKVVKGEK